MTAFKSLAKETIFLIIVWAVTALLVFGIFFAGVYYKKDKPQDYPTCGVVVEVNYKNDLVVVEDFNGNLWEFEGCEDWLEGDIASMIMNDCGTPEIYDDEIITVRYSGYVEN